MTSGKTLDEVLRLAFRAGVNWTDEEEQAFSDREIEEAFQQWRRSAFGLMGDEDTTGGSGTAPAMVGEPGPDAEGQETDSGSSPRICPCSDPAFTHTANYHIYKDAQQAPSR